MADDREEPGNREGSGSEVIRTLVLDGDRATAEAIAGGLSAAADVHAVATARTADEALAIVARPGPRVDMVVVGSTFPREETLRLARIFRSRDDMPCLVVMGLPTSDAAIVQYLESGVDAYITEDLSISGLLLVLRLLDRGELLVAPPTARLLTRRLHALAALLETTGVDVSTLDDLTSRETEILELLGEGAPNKEIARRLFISVGTVKSHVHNILGKLGVQNRDEARRLLILARCSARAATEDLQPG